LNLKKKFFLFKQSKHFCSVPWNHFEVFSNGDVRTCSKGEIFGNINKTPIEEILKNNQITTIKHNLLEDKLITNCLGCHELATEGEHYDLRNHYNPMFQNVDIDYENLGEFKLHGIDLHWDNTCNFKCIYCNAKQSSLIAQEQGIPVTKSIPENIDKIIDMVVKNQYVMKEIYLSGGEPLLIKHNVKLLSQIENKELPIRINSNISVANDKNPVFLEIKKFKNVLWTISADTVGEKFNYIRNGGDWDSTLKNLETIKSLSHQIRLNAVFFIGNVVDMFDTLEYFIREHGIVDITINQLSRHKYLLARNSPESLKIEAKNKLQKLLDANIIPYKSNAYYNIARCQKEIDQSVENSTGYVEYFTRLDVIRGTNWRQIFPELVR
jgi:molybdenum cofactor biosynthesis enzyme MoaA